MEKLFIAIDLPDDAVRSLQDIQPQETPEVSLIDGRNLHISLLSIGDAEVDKVDECLQALDLTQFNAKFVGLGKFAARKNTILWACVEPIDLLQSLRNLVIDALAPIMSTAPSKKFKPQVTLARCSDATSSEMIDAYLQQSMGSANKEFTISGLTLYSMHQSKGSSYSKQQLQYSF
jgi:2'-5' RNA ligase